MTAAAPDVVFVALDAAPADARSAWRLLDQYERARAQRLREARDRDRYVVVHAAVRVLLASRAAVPPADVLLARRCASCGASDHGKPVLGDGTTGVSLSYSGRWAALAVGEADIGVDLEALGEPLGTELARAVLTESELAQWQRLTLSARGPYLLRLWTLKEAHLKGCGTGLATLPSTVDVAPLVKAGRLAPLAGPDGTVAAVSGRAAVDATTRRLSASSLLRQR